LDLSVACIQRGRRTNPRCTQRRRSRADQYGGKTCYASLDHVKRVFVVSIPQGRQGNQSSSEPIIIFHHHTAKRQHLPTSRINTPRESINLPSTERASPTYTRDTGTTSLNAPDRSPTPHFRDCTNSPSTESPQTSTSSDDSDLEGLMSDLWAIGSRPEVHGAICRALSG
jgi:hypothetical protein